MFTAVYSGTFDPIHLGHAAMAAYVSQQPDVSRVLMLVSPLNPLKQGSTRLFTDEQRLQMVRDTMAADSRIEVSDFEWQLPRPSYTIHTLDALRRRLPGEQLRLVVGADNLADISRWRSPERIIGDYGLIVYPRPGISMDVDTADQISRAYGHPGAITYLEGAPVFDISSTFIRRQLAVGRSVRHFVPDAACRLIDSILNK